ncbi:hypothetical protein [Salinactinospora qingdaonensis]|uniref:Solute:sodium symporter small subunit n=1 Tax=Salinactinospora qingdaonensis TaxID=702744 RepID=A0ABP7FCP4_9ACTN
MRRQLALAVSFIGGGVLLLSIPLTLALLPPHLTGFLPELAWQVWFVAAAAIPPFALLSVIALVSMAERTEQRFARGAGLGVEHERAPREIHG